MNNGQYYVGSTRNLAKRLLQHQNGESKSTKKYLPIVLLYSQHYETIIEAIQIETKIKKWKNRQMIESFMQQK